MEQRIIRMALQTWDTIGGDCLTCLEEMGKKPIMTKEDVIDTVCDASYMQMHGGDKEAYEHWNALPSYEAKKAAVEKAFVFLRYGW